MHVISNLVFLACIDPVTRDIHSTVRSNKDDSTAHLSVRAINQQIALARSFNSSLVRHPFTDRPSTGKHVYTNRGDEWCDRGASLPIQSEREILAERWLE